MKYDSSLYEQELARVQRDYEYKNSLKIVFSLFGSILSIFALISLTGIITHSQWVGIPQYSVSSMPESLMVFLFNSGTVFTAIFASAAIIFWVLRARI